MAALKGSKTEKNLKDAFDDLFDCAVIVSNDSDLKEPIAQVRNRFGSAQVNRWSARPTPR